MAQQPYQTAPQSVPTPPGGTTAPPTQGGAGLSAGLQTYEVQFLGGLLGGIGREIAPHALRWLQERIRTMGAGAQNEAQVAQEAEQFQVQFLNFIGPLIPHLVNLGGSLLNRAISGQAAGGGDTQSAGAGAPQGAGPVGSGYYRQ